MDVTPPFEEIPLLRKDCLTLGCHTRVFSSALNMRLGSLYATFGSKSGLFFEALKAYAVRSGDEFEQAKAMGELRADVECPRLARLLQTQIIGLRAFAERDVPRAQVGALAEDMVSMLDAYRLG